MSFYYFERKSDKALITLDTAYLFNPVYLASEYVLIRRSEDLEK